MSTGKTDAAIYTMAAENIDEKTRHFSCMAVQWACDRAGRGSRRMLESYRDLFSPYDAGPRESVAGHYWNRSDRSKRHRDLRVMALLFMAAMAERGDL
jgi:hypothetical protein